MRTCLLAAALLSASAGYAATPTIDSVTGTVASGQTLAITGTNLVQEDKTNWQAGFKTAYGFEGSSYTEDGWALPGDINSHAPVYDRTVRLSGSQSVKFRTSGPREAGPGGLTSYLYRDSPSQDIWLRGYVKLYSANDQWAIGHSKMIDWQGTGGAGSGQFYFQPSAGDNLPVPMLMAYDGTGHAGAARIDSDDTWHLFELHWKCSTPHAFSAYWLLMDHATPTTIGSNMTFVLLGFINIAGTSDGFDASYWFDNFAISSSRIYPSSTIEISGDGTIWKYQYPVFLSDTSSQVKIDLSGLSGTNYRLRVTNNQQQTSEVYTLGSVAAPDAGMPADAGSPPGQDASTAGVDAAGMPAAVTNLAVVATTSNSATLSFDEVGDGLGHPASYYVRFSRPPMEWGAATTVSQGTCSTPMAGQSIGASRNCTVEGLSPAATYEFQLVAFRGTLNLDAAFGPLSNLARGATAPGGGVDAGHADAGQAGLDASNCVAGAPCSSADGCRAGTIDCVSEQPQCGHWADVVDGTACQGSNICSSGVCRACAAEASCTTADGCRVGKTSCTTGEAVCQDLENAPNGTACGTQGTCQQGVCSVCPAGEVCGSFDGCQVGTVDCSRTPAVCGAFTNRPDGVACSGGGVRRRDLPAVHAGGRLQPCGAVQDRRHRLLHRRAGVRGARQSR
ncbi:MAG: fibronectin type III domain-containing protein [Deltaproteobacteria bacterium]|nr:fibronectin type III domain-containing protein [Deltaproteobacteria bacterium]